MRGLKILNKTDIARREALLIRIERLTELPLLILAFVMIPLIVGPYLWDLSTEEQATFIALDMFIWAVFAADLVIKLLITPNRRLYLRKHWLEVLIVIIPFFRPLRLIRLFIFGSRAFVGVRRLVHVDFLVVYGIGLVVIAATVIASVEIGENASIHSFADALWWAVVTITTVGYGDMVPVTAIGRAVAFILMLGGIAFFSGVTANLASFLVRGEDIHNKALAHLAHEVEKLNKEVIELRKDQS